MDWLATLETTKGVLLLIIGIGLIIFVHELGHFLVAKFVRIKVDQFAIGFGHALLAWRKGIGFRLGTTEPTYYKLIVGYLNGSLQEQPDFATRFKILHPIEPIPVQTLDDVKKQDTKLIERAARDLGLGETEYRMNWMPLGGYVKMVGQDDLDPNKTSEDPRAYNNKPIWARICVVGAGVVMNLIFGAVFFIAAFLHGVMFPPAEVGWVRQGSPALSAEAVDQPEVVGLMPGDQFISVNDKSASDFTEVRIEIALSSGEDAVDLTVLRPAYRDRPEQKLTFTMKPRPDEKKILHIGVEAPFTLDLPKGETGKEHRYYAKNLKPFGLREGLTLQQVNGHAVEHYWQYATDVLGSEGKPLELSFGDKDTDKDTVVTIEPDTELSIAKLPIMFKGKPEKQAVANLLGMVPPVKFGSVARNGPAHGIIEVDDAVAAVNDVKWPTLVEVQKAVTESKSGPIKLTVIRDGQRLDLSVKPERRWFRDPRIGVQLTWADDDTTVARVLDDSPFADLKWLGGTKIKAIGDREVSSLRELRLALQNHGPGAATVTYELPLAGGHVETGTVELDEERFARISALRWTDPIHFFTSLKVNQQADDPLMAARMGVDKTWLFVKQVYVTLLRLAQGTVKAEHLMGPVGIAVAGSRFAEGGWAYLMFFLGLISVNLAVINFLPIPILDGGLFVMLLIEKVRGKPLPAAVQSAATIVGLVLIGSLILFVTFQDIVRVIQGS